MERYAKLWDKLLHSVGSDATPGEDRLDALVVREVWKMSRLGTPSLARIWNQCDPAKQGTLDKAAFCKGLYLIDEELGRRRRANGT